MAPLTHVLERLAQVSGEEVVYARVPGGAPALDVPENAASGLAPEEDADERAGDDADATEEDAAGADPAAGDDAATRDAGSDGRAAAAPAGGERADGREGRRPRRHDRVD